MESHPNSAPYPIVAIAPRFCSVIHSAKLRLRASPSAQNDIQRFCLLFVVSQRQTTFLADRVWRVSLRLGHAHVLTVHRTVIHYAHAASLPSRSRQQKRTLRSRRPSIGKLRTCFDKPLVSKFLRGRGGTSRKKFPHISHSPQHTKKEPTLWSTPIL